jgi:hypothetical protein
MGDSLGVRRLQRGYDLQRDRQRALRRQGTSQRSRLDIFHYQIVRPDIEQCANVRVIQRSNYASLPLESIGEPLLGKLDGYNSAKAGVQSLVDLSHSASAHEGEDFVRAELISGFERHNDLNDSTVDRPGHPLRPYCRLPGQSRLRMPMLSGRLLRGSFRYW